MRSPSYHAVGLMVPGLPIIGVGRNPGVAWGGTNLRAASSDLFDVSGLPPEDFRTETVRLSQRLWFDTTRRVRTTPMGPVISDATLLPSGGATLALRWVGHAPTDEITALLRAARATDGDGFRRAFAGFGVSPQTMLWADSEGRIGRFIATTIPDRAGFPAGDFVLDARDPGATAPWEQVARPSKPARGSRPPVRRARLRQQPPALGGAAGSAAARLLLLRRRPRAAARGAAGGDAAPHAGEPRRHPARRAEPARGADGGAAQRPACRAARRPSRAGAARCPRRLAGRLRRGQPRARRLRDAAAAPRARAARRLPRATRSGEPVELPHHLPAARPGRAARGAPQRRAPRRRAGRAGRSRTDRRLGRDPPGADARIGW